MQATLVALVPPVNMSFVHSRALLLKPIQELLALAVCDQGAT